MPNRDLAVDPLFVFELRDHRPFVTAKRREFAIQGIEPLGVIGVLRDRRENRPHHFVDMPDIAFRSIDSATIIVSMRATFEFSSDFV